MSLEFKMKFTNSEDETFETPGLPGALIDSTNTETQQTINLRCSSTTILKLSQFDFAGLKKVELIIGNSTTAAYTIEKTDNSKLNISYSFNVDGTNISETLNITKYINQSGI